MGLTQLTTRAFTALAQSQIQFYQLPLILTALLRVA